MGGAGSGDARVFLPLGVTAAPDGTIYVTLDETLKHFDAAGTYLGSWGSESGSVGAGDGEFWHPYDVAVAPDGVTVYVADTNNHRVQIFEAAPCADGGGRAEQPTRSIRWGAGESVVAFADTP